VTFNISTEHIRKLTSRKSNPKQPMLSTCRE
jgi:hypothetical protein